MDVLDHHAFGALAAAGQQITGEEGLDGALSAIAEGAAAATRAEVALVRVVDGGGGLRLRAVWARSPALAAELEGSRFPTQDLPAAETSDPADMPAAVLAAADRVRAGALLLEPVWIAGAPVASLEVLRDAPAFGLEEQALARVAAAQLSLAVLALGNHNGAADGAVTEHTLALAGDALAAGLGVSTFADEIAYLALQATGAADARLLSMTEDGEPVALATAGGQDAWPELSVSAAQLVVGEHSGVVPDGALVSVRLGSPPSGILQLRFDSPPPEGVLRGLASFGSRAGHALRAGERLADMSADLERSQALVAVVGQAIAQLSLAHTLATASDRIAELLAAHRIAIYLLDERRLEAAHVRGVAGPHVAVAERLLDLALGPFRAQGMLHVTDAAADLRLGSVRGSVSEVGIEAVVAVPLLVREELIGLVVVYLPLGRAPSEHESTLLSALATQLAVAVQNARLHEDVKRLAAERARALEAEAGRARQLSALHEISSSFASSLSLDATLHAIVRAAVELLGADAAVIRVPDTRSGQLVARASHVADGRLTEPLRPLLERPQPLEKLPGRRLFRSGRPLVLDPESAARLGASYELLVPFLTQGSSAAVIPIATPAELLATLTLVSLDPARRIGTEAIDTALAVAGQAALAIDNARLYQQQKRFADTMQRSMLPQELPAVEGLEVGAVYESSARLDVGGDVYDFLPLPDGRLAVILGDVAGHGIEATADMALAKFVFRALAREHPEPGDFLAHANEVACEEVTGNKFITMLYLAFDPARGEVAIARAGHPPPRLLADDGSVSELAPAGLALGVQAGQKYEEIRVAFQPEAAVCLYTDGIAEARREDDQYGEARLDAALAAGRGLPAQSLAEHLVADCKAFAGSELVDDCAVVVVRRI